MENQESKTGHYNALVWLLMTDYDKATKQYTPTDYLRATYEPLLSNGTGLDLVVLDSTLFDFTLTKSVGDYLSLIEDTTSKFQNALVLLSFINEKNILRDCYLANLAKVYTCWDTAYINCPVPEKITTDAFDFIIKPEELPNGLTQIIK